ncbi:nucleotidyl transferase AbiEii/AbiGii toxin family protein [Candidatus Peregrinibacteria bacterium]|nr:nucleotidyl transferase AbiEii/AbiGii toxin family protein [Candidatus Peregrinibacteria bacterium]
MQNLTRLIREAKTGNSTDQQLQNMIREYLQVLILKAIYQSKYGSSLSFIGGTCLRICYNLRRYSEDLDFALDRKPHKYSFKELNEIIAGYLKYTDFEVDLSIQEEKTVQKSFIRVGRIMHFFGLSKLKSQKLHVKLEIDTNPVYVIDKEIETFFVTKFDENFPILKHTDDTLFAGKICAALNCTYTKGRDFYDLIWYLNKGTKINFRYLNKAFVRAGFKQQFKDEREVVNRLDEKIRIVDVKDIFRDVNRFLEDSGEEKWVNDYPVAFRQAAKHFLELKLKNP